MAPLAGRDYRQIHLGKVVGWARLERQLMRRVWCRDKAALLRRGSGVKLYLRFSPGHPPPRTKNEIWEKVRSSKTISLET